MNTTIKVIGKQDNDGEAIITTVNGAHIVKGDKHFIEYIEIDPESGIKTLNELEFHKDQVIVKRTGLVNATMVFDPSKKSSLLYETGYGAVELVIRTKLISINNEGDCQRFSIAYQIENNNQDVLSENSLMIEIGQE